MVGQIEKLDERIRREEERLPELRSRVAELPAFSGPDAAAVEAEFRTRGAYFGSLASLYAAEKRAGIEAPPAPRDPNAPEDPLAKGVRSKVDARIVSVRTFGGRTMLRFARGGGGDPAGWSDEADALAEGPLDLAAGDVAVLDVIFLPGQSPAWRVTGVERK